MSQDQDNVVARECRFSWHIPERNGHNPDLHLVKEIVHLKDGTTEPRLRWIKDFKRSLYITRSNKRTHKDKREWEELGNVLEKKVTQSDLRMAVARLLDKGWSKDHLKKLAQSPYLYGTDISSTSLIKKMYQDRFPTANTPFNVATYDIESDVVRGTEEVIIVSVIYKNKVHIAVTEEFIRGIACIEEVFQRAVNKYIGDYVTKRNLEINLYVAKDVIDLIDSGFKKVHEWKPDFLAIWNMDYDIPKILSMFEKYDIDPRDVLCDPSIPKELRFCKYVQGPKKKVTAAGKVIPINPAAQWHTLQLAASFYVIDAMCAYKHIRLGEQEEPSYSLDAILQKKLGIRKLKFQEADDYVGLRWHQVMQRDFKVEYMVYNIFDSLSMIELDESTNDLSSTLPTFSATSDFWNFKSQPRRIADALHFYALDNGYVMGTVGSVDAPKEKEIDEDDVSDDDSSDGEDEAVAEEHQTLDRRGWVITLPAHMSVLGLKLVLEDPGLHTNIRAFVYDSDATSAYPSATSVANVSKRTTRKEIISIEGIDEYDFRMQNLNLVVGRVNSIEYATEMFKFPKPEELLTQFVLNNIQEKTHG